MIPVNNAIWTAAIAVALTAVAVGAVAWSYWRRRVEDAYQDGHSAGIATQVARQSRATRHRAAIDSGTLPAVMRGRHRAITGPPASDVTVADVTDALRTAPRPAPPVVIPFPEGLPPGLREFAQDTLATADERKWGMLP
jgi:hypothetical protein